MMKSNVILLHGRWPERIDGKLIADIPLCNPNNKGNWMGWNKARLMEAGYEVSCPIIDDAWQAPYSTWSKLLDGEKIEEDTILVGLSAGGYAMLRYLIESKKRVKKLILIAPGSKLTATEADPLESKHEFYSVEVSADLTSQIEDQVVIFVSNDSPEILKPVEMYAQVLDAKIVRLEDLGHFSFLIPELPELLEEITR